MNETDKLNLSASAELNDDDLNGVAGGVGIGRRRSGTSVTAGMTGTTQSTVTTANFVTNGKITGATAGIVTADVAMGQGQTTTQATTLPFTGVTTGKKTTGLTGLKVDQL